MASVYDMVAAGADGPLGSLLLSRSGVDRHGERRGEIDLIDRLRGDRATRVVRLRDGRALVTLDPPALVLELDPGPELPQTLWLYLGEDGEGRGCLGAVDLRPFDEADGTPAADESGSSWRSLREVGAVLGERDAGLFTAALALANWHATHPRCSRCGEPTTSQNGGWTRRCPVDASEHYPRTDPAIIVSVLDDQDRVLLGRGPTWPQGRFSTLAGFVEPGESLEDAVRREVAEESGVRVGEVTYLGSQPWPFPASLMIGCTALAVEPTIVVDGVEIVEAHWFSREQVRELAGSGELLLPSGISIARRLVEHWYGGELPQEGTWR